MVLKNSIRRRTFLYFSSGMLLIILAFTLLFTHYFYGVFKERIESDQLRATSAMADRMNTLLMNIKQNAYYLCSNEHLASLLVNKEGYPTVVQRDQISATFNMCTGTLTTPLMRSASAVLLVDSQFPLSKNIRGSFSANWGNLSRQRVYSVLDVKDAEWYQRTVSLQGQIHAFWDPQGPDTAFFAQRLRSTRIASPKYSEELGVALYALPCSEVQKILDNARITQGSAAVFLFEDSIFLSSSGSWLFPSGAEAAAQLRGLRADGTTAQIRIDGVRYTASTSRFQGNWTGILLIPHADLLRYISTPLPMLFAVILLFLLVSGLLSFLLTRRLVRPVIRLSDVMAQVQDTQDLPPPLPAPAAQDEIAVLYHSYNRMLEWIQRLIEEAVEEAEKLRQAQLKSMQAQINPHFIYNTLDSVSCSALLEGNDDIVTMVTSLISILKYSVNFSRTAVPLREEIDYLQHYIRIQQLRYKNGFSFVCEVPEKYYPVRISQIILQPLVENALFHAQSQEQLQICLFCEEVGEQLRIHVTDNGTGSDAARLNQMLQTAEDADSLAIGIRNVNNRLRLFSGKDSGLHYEQMENGGLDAIIQLPLEFV